MAREGRPAVFVFLTGWLAACLFSSALAAPRPGSAFPGKRTRPAAAHPNEEKTINFGESGLMHFVVDDDDAPPPSIVAPSAGLTVPTGPADLKVVISVSGYGSLISLAVNNDNSPEANLVVRREDGKVVLADSVEMAAHADKGFVGSAGAPPDNIQVNTTLNLITDISQI